jgi:hypothetical protein
MPQTAGMYGKGIYFATDSSKSALYTQGSKELLLCDVILGRSLVVYQADASLCHEYLHSEGYDSVYAPRGTKSSGGVEKDEFGPGIS